jgi:hypothetical protein
MGKKKKACSLDYVLLESLQLCTFPGMKNGLISLQFWAAFTMPVLMLAGCAGSQAEAVESDEEENRMYYGSVIDLDDALDAAGLRTALETDGRAAVRFEGEITATCPKKGCWMDVASGEDTVFVRFLDYGFFVPTEGAEGKRTIMEGEAFFDTLTVDARRHYAEDAGASEEEIAAITEPELKLAFTATGVMIED